MKKFIVLLIAIYYCVSSFATTININAESTGDYPTIQAAIDAAIIGDIIVLSDGTYSGEGNYDIKFNSKSIILRSANGPEKCIINCQENGRGFLFDEGEDRDSVLSGVTIKKALAKEGAAIYCINSSPTITNCIMTKNIIIADGTGWGSGAGVHSSKGSPLISHCRIIDNICRSGKLKAGGIYAEYGRIKIIDCTVSGHRSTGFGRYSTGITIYSSNGIVVRDCIVTNNIGRSAGGILINDSTGIVDNCLVAGNVAIYPNVSWAGVGGGISVNSGNVTIANCTIVGNVANLKGGGLSFGYDAVANVYNCIIWDNITLLSSNRMDIGGSEYANVNNCNIGGNFFGSANISKEPFFVKPGYWGSEDYFNQRYHLGDYHLQRISPCIDAGENSVIAANSTDIDGNPRILNEIVDMGAYEYLIPVADAGLDLVLSADGACGASVILDGSASSDEGGNELTYYWYYDGQLFGEGVEVQAGLGLGAHVFTLIVNNGTDDSLPDEVVITVVDDTPPGFTVGVDRSSLWPPNQKMVEVTPSFDVSDNCGGEVAIELVDIICNQESEGDIEVTDEGIFLRAERDARDKDGRVYTIIYKVTDGAGNETAASTEVKVPHESRQAKTRGIRGRYSKGISETRGRRVNEGLNRRMSN